MLSVLVHAVALAAIRFTVTLDRETTSGIAYPRVADGRMRVYDLRVAGESFANPDHPAPPPDASPLDAGLAASIAAPDTTSRREAPPAVESAGADPRIPRFADPRLWSGEAVPVETTDGLGAERARIERGIESYNDSVAGASEAEKRVTDWTRIDANGVRWGASPGALHLGRITLRYCGGGHSRLDCGVGVSPGRIREYEQRIRRFAEIERQRGRVELDAILKSRAGAMRARTDAKRDSARGG
jgi:hypothetical protein